VAVSKKDRIRSKRRGQRVKAKIKRISSLPRVSVTRTLKQIYAQIIDDNTQNTLVSCNSVQLKDAQGDKTAVAHAVGVELAKRATKLGVDAVVFDRGQFKYHGRIKSLADGLREGGMKL
jgi:large subunit ribosomal protein L18